MGGLLRFLAPWGVLELVYVIMHGTLTPLAHDWLPMEARVTFVVLAFWCAFGYRDAFGGKLSEGTYNIARGLDVVVHDGGTVTIIDQRPGQADPWKGRPRDEKPV